MHISIKIQNLLKTKDLKQKALAKAMEIGERHLSKKIGWEMDFSQPQIVAAAAFLGVTESFLKDESRPFNLGDEIPSDAVAEIAQEPAGPEPPPDPSDAATILARTQEAMVSKVPDMVRDIVRAEMEKMMEEPQRRQIQMRFGKTLTTQLSSGSSVRTPLHESISALPCVLPPETPPI